MNQELIEDCVTHAEFHVGNEHYMKTGEEQRRIWVETYTNLIIQECMTTILKESQWYWDKDEFECSNAILNAARRVKERFGVTE